MSEVVVNVDERKEILEILAGIKPLAEVGFKVAADGKVNLADLKYLVDLVKSFDVIKEAIKIPKGFEFKDMDGEDLKVVGEAAFNLVKDIIALKNEK